MRSDLVAEGICRKLRKKRSRLTADKCHLKNRTREKNISFSVTKNFVGNIWIFVSFTVNNTLFSTEVKKYHFIAGTY